MLKQSSELAEGLGQTWVDNSGVLTCNLYIHGVAQSFAKYVEEAVEQLQNSFTVVIKPNTLDGKVAVTGHVISFWQQRNDYGVQQGFTVMLDNDGATYGYAFHVTL